MKVKLRFTVSTRYIHSKVSEELTVDIPDDLTDKEKDEYYEKIYGDWLLENIDGGWEEIEQ